jgi:hypothetical protein
MKIKDGIWVGLWMDVLKAIRKWIGLISNSYSTPNKMFKSLGMDQFLTYPSPSG